MRIYKNIRIKNNHILSALTHWLSYTVMALIINVISIDVKPRKLPGPSLGYLFRLLRNSLLLFCRDLAVLIFTMLLADIQRPN